MADLVRELLWILNHGDLTEFFPAAAVVNVDIWIWHIITLFFCICLTQCFLLLAFPLFWGSNRSRVSLFVIWSFRRIGSRTFLNLRVFREMLHDTIGWWTKDLDSLGHRRTIWFDCKGSNKSTISSFCMDYYATELMSINDFSLHFWYDFV